MHLMKRRTLFATCYAFFFTWASSISTPFPLPPGGIRKPRGWFAVSRADFWRNMSFRFRCLGELAYACIVRIHRNTYDLLKEDKAQYISDQAWRVQKCNASGNIKGCFKIIRMLRITKAKPCKAVKLNDGSVAKDEQARIERWTEHFSRVMGGRNVAWQDIFSIPVKTFEKFYDAIVDFGPCRIMKATSLLPSGKGVGPDGVPAELYRAGCEQVAIVISRICIDARDRLTWPSAFKGGRLVDLWKSKGDPSVCDNSRGLLLSDHISKIPTSIMKWEIDAFYNNSILYTQFGAVPGRGADLAHHVMESALQLSMALEISAALIFLDLEKAFDKAIREMVMGFLANIEDEPLAQRNYSRAIGVSEVAADTVLSFFCRWRPDSYEMGC